MKGRPKKQHLEVKRDEGRNRWLVIVPASWAGKQSRRWFESESAAHIWAAEREVEKAAQRPINISESHRNGKSIKRLVAIFLGERKGQPGHKAAANHLDKFVAQFGGSTLDALQPYAIKQWLKRLPGSPRTRWGIFGTCRTMARWAQRYRFAEGNPFESVEPPAKGMAPKAILTVDEMKLLLELPKLPYMQAWIAFGGFAGLRSDEILKLKWSSVDFGAGEIHVPPEAIKKTAGGMREKYVTMLPAFIRIVPRDLHGKVIPVSRTTFHYHATRLAQKLGYQKWPHNCLRHSFASYHLAMWENASITAHQLGHTSTKMVYENYARAVKKADAIQWWSL